MPEEIKESKIILTNKSELCLSGVTEFISSTNEAVCLAINNEEFIVEGKNLSVVNLDTERGVLELKGDVKQMGFEKTGKDKFSFKKLFNR